MSNLALRALSAVVALPLLALLVLWAPPVGFGLLVLLVAGLALHECAAIMLAGAAPRFRNTIVALGVVFTAALYFAPDLAFPCTLAALTATAAAVLFDPGEIPAAGHRLGAAVFSVLYVGGLAAPLALLQRDADHGRAWVLLAVAVTFGNDTGAYFAGKAFGRHNLYPKVSPAKSVEGAIGGMVASVGLMFALRAAVCPWLTVG
ncbi:MAG TPA: phosphatidate cytidylyltransferase, partial [Polyangia bacterium]|nr:phosphatidate cytidylyltransferase [Polyangia bacterium]